MSDELDTTGAVEAFMGGSLPDRARASMAEAVNTKPDFEVRIRQMSEAAGVPVATARTLPDEVNRKATLASTDFDEMAQRFPSTTEFIAQQENAKIAHDDIKNMGLVESSINSFKRGALGARQIIPSLELANNAAGLAQLDEVDRLLADRIKPEQMDLSKLGVLAQMYVGMTPQERLAFRQTINPNLSQNIGDSASSVAGLQVRKQDSPSKPGIEEFSNAKTWGAAFSALGKHPLDILATIGPESFVQSAPGMLAAIPAGIAGGPGAAMGTVGVNSFAVDYASTVQSVLQDAGIDLASPDAVKKAMRDPAIVEKILHQASRHAAVVAPIDAISGGIASKVLLPKAVMTRLAAKPIAREVASMAVQTPTQAALGAAGEAGGELAAGQQIQPGQILGEAVGELTGTPVEVATMSAGRVKEVLQERSVRKQQAEQAAKSAEALSSVMAAASESKLRERDPVAFADFVQKTADAGGSTPTEVFIDANALTEAFNQAGVTPEQAAAALPSIGPQMTEALARGGDVSIPIGEFAAGIAGSPLEQSLMQHVRTSPEELSQADHKALGEVDMKAEAEKLATQQVTEDAAATVRQNILDQLNTAGRFSPAVNAAYAEATAALYATQAERLGITPDEFLKRYPLRVGATDIAEGQILGQAAKQVAQAQITDKTGEAFNVGVSREAFGADKKSDSVMIEVRDPKTGDRRGFVDFTVLPDGTLSAENAKVAPAFQKRGLAEAMYKAARDAGFDIAPGRVQTEAGAKMVSSLQSKGLINKERASLNQGEGNRASYNPETSSIILAAQSDLTSFNHELAHHYLEVLSDMASQKDAPPQVVKDMNKVLEWFGVKDLETWKGMSLDEQRDYHEKFARGYEAYLFEGSAPSTALAKVFARFSEWARNIYKSIKALNVDINDEVRGVYDRMLASEAAIKEAEAVRDYLPLFLDDKQIKEAGLDPEAYKALNAKATQEGVTLLQSKGVRDMKWLSNAKDKALKAIQKQVAETRKSVAEKVKDEVAQMQVYSAENFLRYGKLEIENQTNAQRKLIDSTAGLSTKLDLGALKEMYGEWPAAPWRYLPTGKNGMAISKGGISPRVVAEIFNYTSADEMVKDLLSAVPQKELVEQLTDQRMLQEHGELSGQEALNRAAALAVHNEARGRFIATELHAVAKELGPVRVIIAAAKQFAANVVGAKKVLDIRPKEYEAAETRATKEAEKALGKKDPAEVAKAKRNEILNHYAAKEAYEAQEYVAKSLEYFKRVQKPGKIPAAYFEQITKLLERFDLRQSVGRGEIDNRASFRSWAKAQLDAGEIPPNVEMLLSEVGRKAYAADLQARNEEGELIYEQPEDQAALLATYLDLEPARSYKEMTYAEFRALRDTIEQIEHVGRRTENVLTAKDGRLFKEEVTRLKDHIKDVAEKAGRKANDTRTPNNEKALRRLGWRGFFFSHIKAATEVNVMDGGIAGPVWERLIETANSAGNGEVKQVGEYHDKVKALLETLHDKGKFNDKPVFFPSLNESLNRNAILSMASEMGNASNRQRLLGGNGWTMAQIQPVLATLTEADWRFVQGLWDLHEELRPQVGEMERKIRGVEPDWIQAEHFTVHTADGKTINLRGGYSPVVYDPRASGKAMGYADEKQAKEMMQIARMAAAVNRSFTKARVEEVKGRPLLLSLDAKIGGIQDTIHYLHWQPWVIDANRFIKALDPVIREHYGHEVVKMLRDWVGDNAAGMKAPRDAAERKITSLARNVSFAGLAFNIISAAGQVAGFTQSMVILGEGGGAASGSAWLVKGLARTLGSPREAYDQALEKSDFMRKRASTRIRDLAEVNATVQGQSAARQKFDRWGYAMMMAMQAAVDVPTWWGAFEKAMADPVNAADETKAIKLADQAVIDSQGSGTIKDQASIERATGAIRLLTGFMSFMNTTMNLNYRVLKNDTNAARKAMDLLLINVIPVMIAMSVKAILTPGDADKDKESLAKRYAREQFSYVFGQMVGVREIAQMMAAFQGAPGSDYGGSVGLRMAADLLKLAKQVGQGTADEQAIKATVQVAGDFLRLPAAQINRTISGVSAINKGKTHNPTAILLGFQEPH